MKLIVFDSMNHLKTVMRAMPMGRQIEAYEVFNTSLHEVRLIEGVLRRTRL